MRLPAMELERAVLEAVRRLLENPLRLSEHFSTLPVRDTQRLLESGEEKGLRLSDVATSATRVLARSLLRRVTILDGELHIEIERSGIGNEMLDTSGRELSGKPIILTVPFEMRRRGREVRLVIKGSHSEAEPISSLTRAVAMARDWAERVAVGEVFELNQLAAEYGIERSYAQKVFRCVALSPQHIEAILTGKHDQGLTFAAATADIPLQWQLQSL